MPLSYGPHQPPIDDWTPPPRPHPPRNPRPTPPPTTGTTPDTLKRAVLYNVSPNLLNPTSASVFIENTLPARSGFTLPANFGPVYAAGTTSATINGKTVTIGGPYICDPNTQEGGSWVLVDLTTNTVVQVLQGVSNTIPTSASIAVATHVHTGGTDVNGNPMPNQIDLTAHTQGVLPLQKNQPNPSPSTPPVITGSPALTYPYVKSGTYDAKVTFNLTMPTGYANWLCEVIVFAQGTNGGTSFTLSSAVFKAAAAPTSGAYAIVCDGFAAGQAYDLWVAYKDGQGIVCTPAFLATTAANPLAIGNANQLTGASNTTPQVSLVTNNGLSAANTATFDVELTVTTDWAGYTSASNQWIAEIQLWAGVQGGGKPFQAGSLAPVAGSANLVTDSEFATFGGATPLWTASTGMVFQSGGGPGGSNCVKYVGTGSASGFKVFQGSMFNVTPGATYTLSGYIDATYAASTAAYIGIGNTNLSTVYASATQTSGVAGTVSVTFTVPGGVTQVCAFVDTDNVSVTSGHNLLFSQPQLVPGSTASSYVAFSPTQYIGVWPSLGNGNIYNLYMKYVDYAGDFSILSPSITIASATGIGNSAFQLNPNPTVAPAFSVNPHNVGGAVTDTVFSYANSGGTSVDATTAFTLTISNPTWLSEVRMYALPNGAHTDPLASPAGLAIKGDLAPTGTGAYTATFHSMSSDTPYDCYIAYIDLQSNVTPLKFVGTTTAQKLVVTPPHIPTLGGPNLVPCSDFAASNFNSSGIAGSNPYWRFYWIDGLSFIIGSDGVDANGAKGYIGIRPAFSSKNCTGASEVITVNPGVTYTLSGYIDATHCSAGSPAWYITPTNWSPNENAVAPYATAAQTHGVNGIVSASWTCPGGVTQVCVSFASNTATIGSNILVFENPMLQVGPLGPYTLGPSGAGPVATTPPPSGGGGTPTGPGTPPPTHTPVKPPPTGGGYHRLAAMAWQIANHFDSDTDINGATMSSGLLSGRHLSGASTTDYSALMQASDNTFLYNRHTAALTNNINSVGQNTATDFKNTVETNPTAAFYAGLVQTIGTGVYYEKAGTSHDLSKGPLILQMTGQCSGGTYTTTEFAIHALADTNTGTGDPTNSYLAQQNGHNLAIYKRTAGAYTALASVTNNLDQSTGTDHTLTFMLWLPQPGGATTIVSLAAQFDGGPWVTASDSSSARTTGYYGLRSTTGTTNIRDFVVSQGQAPMDAIIGKPLKRNLVVNGNNFNGNATVAPNKYGWTNPGGAGYGSTVASSGGLTVFGNTYACLQCPAGANTGPYQDIPVISGKTYTFVAYVYSATGGQAKLWIGNSAGSVQFNNVVTAPLGLLGSFYTSANASTPYTYVGGSAQVHNNVWEVVCGTFVIPTGYNYARVLLENLGASGPVYFQGVMVHEGNVLQDYIDHELNPGAVTYDQHIVGNLPNSTMFNTNLPNSIANLSSDVLVNFNAGTSGSTTIKVWFTQASSASNNIHGSTLPCWQTPDGTKTISPSAASCGTSGSPAHTYTGLTSGNTYYFVIGYNANTDTFTFGTASTTPPSQTAINAVLGDGNLLVIVASANSANTITAGGGSGSHGGGGGHNFY